MASRSRAPLVVDREKTCPFLVRVFVRQGAHHDATNDFAVDRAPPLLEEASIYTWKDATLREIVLDLIDATPSLKAGYARYSFKLFYLGSSHPPPSAAPSAGAPLARHASRDLGTVFSRDLTLPLHSVNPKGGGLRTLDDYRFGVGDVLSIAVLSGNPNAPSSAAAAPALANQRGPERPSDPLRNGAAGFGIRGRGGGPGARRGGDGPAGWRNGSAREGVDAARWGHNDAEEEGRGRVPERKRGRSPSYGRSASRARGRVGSRSRSPPPRSPARNGMSGWA